MKQSYKLLSMYLDHVDMPQEKQQIQMYKSKDNIDIRDLSEESSVFDYPICIRKISGKRLLQVCQFSDVQQEIDRLLLCNTIIILLDYQCGMEVVDRLFIKRILQFVKLISDQNTNLKITLVASENTVQYYRRIVDELYKEKAYSKISL